MAQSSYQVEPMKGRCAVTGRIFEEGEEFHTVLIEEGESFRREDCGAESWSGPPEGAFCYFKSRVPVKQKRRKLLVDDEVLMNFFVRLGTETLPIRVQFRFVLALILMRKRLLKYESSQLLDGAEVWTMAVPRDQSRHQVVNPRLTDDQIDDVSRELSAILHGETAELIEELERSAAESTDDEDGDVVDADHAAPPSNGADKE